MRGWRREEKRKREEGGKKTGRKGEERKEKTSTILKKKLSIRVLAGKKTWFFMESLDSQAKCKEPQGQEMWGGLCKCSWVVMCKLGPELRPARSQGSMLSFQSPPCQDPDPHRPVSVHTWYSQREKSSCPRVTCHGPGSPTSPTHPSSLSCAISGGSPVLPMEVTRKWLEANCWCPGGTGSNLFPARCCRMAVVSKIA